MTDQGVPENFYKQLQSLAWKLEQVSKVFEEIKAHSYDVPEDSSDPDRAEDAVGNLDQAIKTADELLEALRVFQECAHVEDTCDVEDCSIEADRAACRADMEIRYPSHP